MGAQGTKAALAEGKRDGAAVGTLVLFSVRDELTRQGENERPLKEGRVGKLNLFSALPISFFFY